VWPNGASHNILHFKSLADELIYSLMFQALGVHGHDEEDGHAHAGEETHFPKFLGYSLAALGGIYVFYLFEKMMSMYQHRVRHWHNLVSI